MSNHAFLSLEQLKRRANLLHRAVRRGDRRAARLIVHNVDDFERIDADELSSGQISVEVQHAREAVARLSGFFSWEMAEVVLESEDAEERFYPAGRGPHLNAWFSSYGNARAYLERKGGYLLPYRNHYFVCHARFIETLGLPANDPDWKRIGYDWVRPADWDARRRLEKKLDSLQPDN
jgi:hypothetical protein